MKRSAKSRSRASPSEPDRARDVTREIYRAVRAIPRGRVATYGQLAELVGLPSGHRVVARAMRECPGSLPWHRVVGKKDARRAQISVQEPEHEREQRARLRAEGVRFNAGGCIVLREHGWLPT